MTAEWWPKPPEGLDAMQRRTWELATEAAMKAVAERMKQKGIRLEQAFTIPVQDEDYEITDWGNRRWLGLEPEVKYGT